MQAPFQSPLLGGLPAETLSDAPGGALLKRAIPPVLSCGSHYGQSLEPTRVFVTFVFSLFRFLSR